MRSTHSAPSTSKQRGVWRRALTLSALCLAGSPAYAAPARPASESNLESASPTATLAPEWAHPARDEVAERRKGELRRAWLLSVEAVTHAPLDLGFQAGLETPFGLRLFGGYGWVPAAYSDFLTGIAASASGDPQAELLLRRASYQGHTYRVQVGVRPFRRLGLYGDVGYARLTVDGALDLSDSGVPSLQGLGGGYQAHTGVDLWLFELGYQGEYKNRFVWGLALGMLGTFDAHTRIVSVNGAPNSPALALVAASGDAALKSYGFVPTLTLRVGFDLL